MTAKADASWLVPGRGRETPALRPALAAAVLAYAVVLWRFAPGGADAATIGAVGLAALLSSIAGFAFSAIAGAMLFQFRTDSVATIHILLVCSIANQALSVVALRRDMRLAALAPFLAGGLLGVPAGVWLLVHLDPTIYVAGVGALQLAYGGYMLARPPIVLRRPRTVGDLLAGLLGGLFGGFAASPGAPVSVWCGMKGWDKVRQRALFQPFILLMQLLALAAIALLRPASGAAAGIPPVAWLCVPVSVAGTWCGLACFRRMTDRQFARAVNALLIASGAALIL